MTSVQKLMAIHKGWGQVYAHSVLDLDPVERWVKCLERAVSIYADLPEEITGTTDAKQLLHYKTLLIHAFLRGSSQTFYTHESED